MTVDIRHNSMYQCMYVLRGALNVSYDFECIFYFVCPIHESVAQAVA